MADPVIQDLRKQLREMNDRNQSLQVLQQLFPSRTLQLVQLVELYGVVVVHPGTNQARRVLTSFRQRHFS